MNNNQPHTPNSELKPRTAVGIERTLRTLMRSENPAARKTLLSSIDSSDENLSIGSIRALALRNDSQGHRELAARADQMDSEKRAALLQAMVNGPMERSLEKLVETIDTKLSLQVAQLALSGSVVGCLPAIIKRTCTASPEQIADFAAAAVGLAKILQQRVEKSATGEKVIGGDPAFARRASVNELTKAIQIHEEHQRHELIESLLILAPFDEPILQRVLVMPSHAAHEELLNMLRYGDTPAVARMLSHAMQEHTTRQKVLEIVASRNDPKTLKQLFSLIGLPVNLSVRENAAKLSYFAWMDEAISFPFQELNDEQQEVALVLIAASKVPKKTLSRLIEQILDHSSLPMQFAASRYIADLPGRFSSKLVQKSLESSNPDVVAEATKQLGSYEGEANHDFLIELLDHPDERVRRSAQEALPDVNYANFRDQFNEMDEFDKREAGNLVRKGDPDAISSLKRDLMAGAISRRMKGLEMIELMGLATEMSTDVLKRLEDKDLGVRAEAARILGGASSTPKVLHGLALATLEKNPAVSLAAEASAKQLGVLDEIDRLIENLMLEEYL